MAVFMNGHRHGIQGTTSAWCMGGKQVLLMGCQAQPWVGTDTPVVVLYNFALRSVVCHKLVVGVVIYS